MHREYPWPEPMDSNLRRIEQLEVSDVGRWIHAQQTDGRDDAAIHLLLALASARYVDHHGPFIGHGTFNGGPMLRAASILTRPFRNLALLQTAVYVIDLLHQPNYGPYVLMDMEPVTDATVEASRSQLLASIESGEEPLKAEHGLVGLLKTDVGAQVQALLTEAALRQFHENEHRLLIVHRAAQLMDDTDGWDWAEPIYRPAVQYLATRPDVRVSEFPDMPADIVTCPGDPPSIESAVEELIQAEYGDEPRLLREKTSLPIADVIALAAAEMLRRSGFDAHAVTGIHCILDLIHNPGISPRVRGLAIEAALIGQRTRRQKEARSTWRITPDPQPLHWALNDLREIVLHDDSGLSAMTAVGSALRAGVDAAVMARTLMEVALTTAGPFEAIHNVKMLWGQLLETRRSHYPALAWRHLAAGARVVAETAAEDRADVEPILCMWHGAGLSNDQHHSR